MGFTLFSVLLLFAATVAVSFAQDGNSERMQPPSSSLIDGRNPAVAPGLCDNVHSLAGYYPVGNDSKYFYWIFESRSNWKVDPIILWLSGGQGCSSEVALFKEVGPCMLNYDNTTTYSNRFGWNSRASLIFLDQTPGVGFSVGGGNNTSEEDVAEQTYNFLNEFFDANPTLRQNQFWVFGESFGAHYVSAVANRINKENIGADPTKSINLVGVGIGNGLMDPTIQFSEYPEYAINNPIKPLVSNYTYNRMKRAVPHCQRLIEACQTGDEYACRTGQKYCNDYLVRPVTKKGLNPFDVRDKCYYPPYCLDMSSLEVFFGQPEVKKALGVGEEIVWQACNTNSNSTFVKDWSVDSVENIVDLLANGIRVMIYVGDDDYICNYLGNKAWCLEMEWPGQEQFSEASDVPWKIMGDQRGLARTYGNLTFLQMHGAGHMPPMDQPRAAKSMIDALLSKGSLM